MRGTYSPSVGKAYLPFVHEWPDRFIGGPAARTVCGGISAMIDRIEQTKGPVTCPACLAIKNAGPR